MNFFQKYDKKLLFFKLKKFFEPFIELEERRNRFVVYLFSRQVFNIYTAFFKNDIQRLKYYFNLLRLRLVAKRRKIKVAFLYFEPEKWSSIANLYKEFEASNSFESVVYLSAPLESYSHITQKELFERNCKFLDSQNVKYEVLYNVEEDKFLPIKEFKTDILFYQQPWLIPDSQGIKKAAKNTLTCYVPYCFYSLKSRCNYFMNFHGEVWKYFVETEFHKKEYLRDFKAKNCAAFGSSKFDNYNNINMEKAEEHWKSKDKVKIIYAPHHTIDTTDYHNTSTFLKNGRFILELAKKHKDKTEWIFRPHFMLKEKLVKQGKNIDEIEEYYKQWDELGKISKPDDNYYEQFAASDCLITDCISFLSEYLPQNKPVLHLRNKSQAEEFNDLVQNIIDGYYQIYDNDEIEKVFNDVVINKNDYLKEKRAEKIKYLMIDENKTTSKRIREYIEKQLWIN